MGHQLEKDKGLRPHNIGIYDNYVKNLGCISIKKSAIVMD
ncbi:hypothetical protein NVIRPANT_00701 [Pantoea sp. Nvir]|nr:hypothetical protein NVIRPANT_00701 [Pantoea sp. Nvir]